MQKLKKTWRHILRKVLSLVFSRLVVTGLLLLLQAVWLFFLFYKLTEYAQWLTFVGIVISVIMCAALIRQDTTPPEIKISWMVLFMVMPVQGGLLYLLWGDKRPALHLRRCLQRAEAELIPLRTADPAAQEKLERQEPRAAQTARYVREGTLPPCPLDVQAGNGVGHTIPQKISGTEDVRLSLRVRAPFRDGSIVVRQNGREVVRKPMKKALPAEMIWLEIPADRLDRQGDLEVCAEW